MSKPLKIWKTEPYRKMTNPTPGEWYRAPILGDEEQAKGLGRAYGHFASGEIRPLSLS